MPPIIAVPLLAGVLFDPILWTLALVGVLLGRRMKMPVWGAFCAGAALALGGTLVLMAIVNPDREMSFLGFGVRFTGCLIASGAVLLVLRLFDRRKTP